MSITVNTKGKSHARSLIASGDVNTTASWSFSADDGNALLGANGDDWAAYEKMHLAVDSAAGDDTKEHYKYPFGKDGKVYRSGLIAIRQRAGQQNETDVYNAAGTLLELIDDKRSMPKQREVRVANAELRVMSEADQPKKRVGGYAARFNMLSEDLGGFFEKIAPGAFKTSLLTADVRCLFNHDANIIMGRTLSGTLRVVEDDNGLAYEADAPDTQLIRDMVLAPIERGDVTQCSFAFYTVRDHWENVDGKMIRTLLECELLDVSPVTYPAYKDTNVSARALAHVTAPAPILTDILRRRLELAV